MEPGQFIRSGIRSDVALEVHIAALSDVPRIQAGAHFQTGDGRDCNQKTSNAEQGDVTRTNI